ncbi:MAG: hypothetical protein KJO01_09700 [Gammaproteobacteria bacterium]|nr:hypothetical protein [Gammaproteobacteria bacterium]MBT8109117.1 hypothetical protein [Gammaproteobacteria bacterium]NNL43820.1 hypothetical protein [Woeseiaceae bacterium]
MDEFARDYLLLELSMGQYDANHVDAYFGPDEIKSAATNAKLGRDDILAASAGLTSALSRLDTSDDRQLARRAAGLMARLRALDTRVAMSKGEFFDFDEESKRLFGTSAPNYDKSHFEAILRQIDILLPGPGSLTSRVEEFSRAFEIPADRLPAVFEAAIVECRRRTLEYIRLPEGESFTIEYVTDKPWSGYNWYQGSAVSIIQVNTDLPTRIDRAVDLGCHEGYPGHHTYNALLEKNLVVDNNWLEFSVYPLFSPQSPIAEGSANYGIELSFPGEERIEFEKSVLFPLAGLDDALADRYYELLELQAKLSFAGNEAARGYLNGELSREQAIDWLMTYSLSTKERAQQRIRFMETYRSYVINYNHGKAMVANYVETGTTTPAERWEKFEQLLSTSILPENLE